MTQHDPIVRIRHMLEYAREAVELTHGRSRRDLDSDRMLNLALTRLIEVMGEAATRVQEGFRLNHPKIPWRQTVGMRNRLIHGYDTVDFDILWTIIRDDLPQLIKQLEKILEDTQ
jgi:uncharacterized protein with HEPN domain